MRPPKLLCTVLVSSLAFFLVRVNVSPSLPRGFYCRLPGRRLTAGTLVTLCLPPGASALYRDHARAPTGSCPDRLPPFLKAVAATGGDPVTFRPEGLRVAGELLPASAPRRLDSAGRVLPHFPYGTYRLPPGTVWLYAPEPRSFDSRYFGPLPAAVVLYPVMPLWLFAPPPPPCHLRPFSSRLDWRPPHA